MLELPLQLLRVVRGGLRARGRSAQACGCLRGEASRGGRLFPGKPRGVRESPGAMLLNQKPGIRDLKPENLNPKP